MWDDCTKEMEATYSMQTVNTSEYRKRESLHDSKGNFSFFILKSWLRRGFSMTDMKTYCRLKLTIRDY